MATRIPNKLVKQILASVLEEKLSPVEVSKKLGVSLPTIYLKLHASGVSKSDWKHSGIRQGRFATPVDYNKFVETFKAFHEQYRIKEKMTIGECIDIWNKEINAKGDFPAINSPSTYHSWRVNHLTGEAPYHKRNRPVAGGLEHDVSEEIKALSIFLGIPKHEVVAKAVSALRASILKAAQSL